MAVKEVRWTVTRGVITRGNMAIPFGYMISTTRSELGVCLSLGVTTVPAGNGTLIIGLAGWRSGV